MIYFKRQMNIVTSISHLICSNMTLLNSFIFRYVSRKLICNPINIKNYFDVILPPTVNSFEDYKSNAT